MNDRYLQTPKLDALTGPCSITGETPTAQAYLRQLAMRLRYHPDWPKDVAALEALASDLDEHEIAVANMEMAYQDALTRVS